MSNEKIKIMGEPILLKKAKEVVEFDSSLKDLTTQLLLTMTQEEGVGIAAPQIGVSKRIIIFGFNDNSRYPTQKPIPITTLINPEYEVLTGKIIYGWEGCLSVPGLRGLVPRYEKIKYTGYNYKQEKIYGVAEGFAARIIH